MAQVPVLSINKGTAEKRNLLYAKKAGFKLYGRKLFEERQLQVRFEYGDDADVKAIKERSRYHNGVSGSFFPLF